MIGELDISALSDRELKRRIYEAAKLPHVDAPSVAGLVDQLRL